MIGSLSAFFNHIPDGNDDAPLPDCKEFRRDHRHCSSLAQFERRLVQEQTAAGLSAARTRGCLGGRPAVAAADPRMATAKRLHQEHSLSIDVFCKHGGSRGGLSIAIWRCRMGSGGRGTADITPRVSRRPPAWCGSASCVESLPHQPAPAAREPAQQGVDVRVC